MRKRWQINGGFVAVAATVWLVGGVMWLGLGWPGTENHPPAWADLTFLAPFLIAGVVAGFHYGRQWMRDGGYFIRRVHEPIREDLRERPR